MNLVRLKADNYKIFSRQHPENRAKNVNALQYLEGLASRSKVNISSWNIADLFKDPDARGNHIVSDQGKINKIFFEQYEKFRNDAGVEILEIEAMIREPINKIFKDGQEDRATKLRLRINDRVDRATSAFRDAKVQIEDAWKARMELSKLEDGESGLGIEVIEVLKTKFWKYEEFDGIYLKLSTVSDMILTQSNPTAGINLRVNFGKFLVQIDLKSMEIKVFKHENNIEWRDRNYTVIHPHVSSGNEICWGNASDSVAQFMVNGQLKELMETLGAILSNLGGVPYVTLNDFAKLRPNDAPLNADGSQKIPEVEDSDDEEIEYEEEYDGDESL